MNPTRQVQSSGCEFGSESALSDTLQPSIGINRKEGHTVVRSPQQLKLHPALDEIGLIDVVAELNNAYRLKNQQAYGAILITSSGTILAGFAKWQLAVFEGRHEINCIEYPLREDEALQFMLAYHQMQRGWN